MSPAHVHEPTYSATKHRLLPGAWSAGVRIEAARLADDIGVSITPVRDAPYPLAGERMVDFIAGNCFGVPLSSTTEPRRPIELPRLPIHTAAAKTRLPLDGHKNT